MPFSKTESCSTKKWSWIYENLFKPAVEEAGLGFECRRSTATRGSIIRGIIEDLDESYVVLADLTDKNPNVFYELGIRHSIRPRTILVAQKRQHIPFDLRSYASHIYKYDTPERCNTFKNKIRTLLREIDEKPDRSDNPVSDFIKRENEGQEEIMTAVEVEEEVRPLVGPGTERLDVKSLIERLTGDK